MDDILNDSPSGASVDLGDLVNTQPTTTVVPTGAIRNRAATSAILSGEPDQMIEKYRLLMQEGAEGSTVTHDQVMQALSHQNATKNMRHVINILGDKSIPLDQKKRLMNFVQTRDSKEEPAMSLQTKALEAPSEGEDYKGESARISLADTMASIHQEAQERQRMMNGLLATHPAATLSTVGDVAAADVMPFGNNTIAAKVSAKFDELSGKTTSLGDWVRNFLLPGSTKADLQQRLMNIPPDRRGEVTQKLLTAIKESASVFHSDNYYAQYEQATRLLDSPTHSNAEVWMENMSTVLDGLWVASEVKSTFNAASRAERAAGVEFDTSKARRPDSANPGVSDAENMVEHPKWEFVDRPYNPNQIGPQRQRIEYKRADAQKRLELNSVVRRENPVAPFNVIEQANPAEARSLHQQIVEAGSDEAAEAITGVNRQQAIANNIYPQVGTESGNVLNKVDQILKEQITNTGATRYTSDELASAVDVIQHDFRNASGLQINDAMTTFRVDGDHVVIEGHYSTPGGSFLTPEAAREQAKYALRGYGIRDDEITVMKRDGMDYTPHSGPVKQPISDNMPDVPSGHVRLYRAESPTTKFSDVFNKDELKDYSRPEGWTGDSYTSDLKYAKYYKHAYGKDAKIYYVDLPEAVANSRKLAETEFIIDLNKMGSGEGDYIVKVKAKHPIDDSEIQSWNPLDVKRNWTDRISQTITEDKGHISGWLADPASMLHPVITGSASIASDQAIVLENLLLKPIHEFRSTVTNMAKDRRFMVEEYIKEANEKGIKLDHFDLVSRGFNQDEIKALHQWKDIWDKHYYLENYDMVRTLNSQGFQLFENAQTKLFGRSVAKNQNIGPVFDPASNSVRSIDRAEMDSLYNFGGSYVKLRRPINIGGQDVEYMMVRNTPGEYMRKIRDTDQILNYRHGYYTVNYNKGAKFIDELTYSGGREIRRTVAVAKNTQDAETFANAQSASTGNKHVVREDSRGFAKDGDGYWDVNEASGRIAQRLRGQPLVSAKGINQLGAGVFVENPMESAARAARSISGRTVNRPVLETAKARFLKQYEDFLPSDGMGGKRFPNHHSEIVDHGSHVSSKVADARTTYGYIKYLEDGYINTADQIFKGGMHVIANMLNKIPVAEQAALAAAKVSPSHLAKKVVFNAYIVGSNPLRQWIVQPHQATRMIAYNPVGLLNGGLHKRIVGYIGEYAGFKQSSKDINDFVKFVDDSGMVAGVDRNSLVRGLGLSMADSSSKVKRYAGAVGSVPQTLGFDLGEKMNMLGHLAAVHEKWTRAGKNLADKTTRDLALTEARALAYDLNRAGELAYTQSTPAMILQFLQIPHKGMLQLTNRKLPIDVRLRLHAWDLLMFGVGTGSLLGAMRSMWTAAGENGDDILPNDPDTRDMFVYGMESYAMNKVFSNLDESGDKTRIDFSALAPNDMEGWARIYRAMVDDGAFGALAASPVGQLIAVDGVNGSKRTGRIPQALLTAGRYFNVFEELDPENPTEFTAVLNDVAKISSGWTSIQNAKMMLETRKKLDASGSAIDSKVTIPEVWASGLGFGTLATKELYMISRNRIEDKKRHEEDVMKRYRTIMNYYRDELANPNADVAHIQRVSSMLMRTFDTPGDRDLVTKQWMKDMGGKEQGLLKQMLTATGIPDSRKMEDDIKMMPNVDERQKQLLLDRIRGMRELRDRNKELK